MAGWAGRLCALTLESQSHTPLTFVHNRKGHYNSYGLSAYLTQQVSMSQLTSSCSTDRGDRSAWPSRRHFLVHHASAWNVNRLDSRQSSLPFCVQHHLWQRRVSY